MAQRIAIGHIVSTIDVIIPCYNYGHFLPASVDSILNQRGCTIRILIIDDASPDGSVSVAREIAARESRVQVIGHTQNCGHIETYNEGIEWLAATYMLLLSADDLASPGAVSRATSLMDMRPEISFVYGRFTRFSGDAPPEWVGSADNPATTVSRGWDFISKLCADPTNPVETATAIVRTSVQRRVGRYRPELPHAGDFEMWLRCAVVGEVGFVDEIQAFVRMHGGNMRNVYLADQMIGDFQQRHQAFREFFARVDKSPQAIGLETLAARRLAEEVVWAAARIFEEGGDDDGLRRLARSIYPPIDRTKIWWMQSTKRLIGMRKWQAIAPSISRLRGALTKTET